MGSTPVKSAPFSARSGDGAPIPTGQVEGGPSVEVALIGHRSTFRNEADRWSIRVSTARSWSKIMRVTGEFSEVSATPSLSAWSVEVPGGAGRMGYGMSREGNGSRG